jgi:hypothetical protein
MSKHTHTNAITGQTIKATNVDALDQAMQSRRYTQPVWATIQQWKGTGAPVRRGEEGVALEGASGFKWRVFNVAQTGKSTTAEAPRAAKPAASRPAAPVAPKPAPVTRAADCKTFIPSTAPGAVSANTGTVTVAAVALREALEWTRRAMSTDTARIYLCGVYFAPVAKDRLQLVAVDGHRLHAQEIAAKWTGGKVGPGFIMKADTVRALVKEIGGKPRDVTVNAKTVKGVVALTIKVHGGQTFKASAVDATFPDYLRTIPLERLPAFSLAARSVFEAADMAADGTKPKGKRGAAVSVALDAAGVHPQASAVPYAYFNAKYLRDMARMGDVLVVEFAKDTPHCSPACFSDAKAQRWGLLMPTVGDAPAAHEPEAPEAEPVPAEPQAADEPAPEAPALEAVPVEAEPEAVAVPAIIVRRTWRERLAAFFRSLL